MRVDREDRGVEPPTTRSMAVLWLGLDLRGLRLRLLAHQLQGLCVGDVVLGLLVQLVNDLERKHGEINSEFENVLSATFVQRYEQNFLSHSRLLLTSCI